MSETAPADSPLPSLRAALGAVGLHIALPVDLESAGVRLEDHLPGARGAIVVGDGGPAFFASFLQSEARAPANPLDRYTERVVRAAVERGLSGRQIAYALAFPFDGGAPMPFQRLGKSAGIPEAGPLALQIHPEYGPWWAYRALVVLSVPLPIEPPLAASCASCAAPCVQACPASAVRSMGFDLTACVSRRRTTPACAHSCSARQECVIGTKFRYPNEQLAFHMAASLATIRRLAGRAV